MAPPDNSRQVDATDTRQRNLIRVLAVLAVLALATAVLSLSAALYFLSAVGATVTSVPSWWVLIAMTITNGMIGTLLTYSLLRARTTQASANSQEFGRRGNAPN